MRNFIHLSDEELVKAYANGNNEAFDALLARHQQKLFMYILQLVRDHDMADDIFQETFIKAITTIRQGNYSEMGKFAPWLFRIARNLSVDSFRAERNEPTLSADSVGYDILNRRELSDITAEDMMIDLQIEENLHSLIRALPEEQREILELRYYKELPFKEIAQIKNISINTALGRMRYALINLRRMAKEKDACLTR